jgi:FKBP-type peptidyl-prolyl cis-trans isomerase SlyD
VVSLDFHFDLVHANEKAVYAKAACVLVRDSCTHPVRQNVTVKGVSEDVLGMSGEPEETATDAAEDADEESVLTEEIEEETETESTDTEQADEEGLQEDDFIRIAYTARTVDEDEDEGMLVDTTDEEVAEEEGVADEGTFEPRVIILGAGHIMESVEEDIIGEEVGSTGNVVVPPTEAFGEYDPDEVSTVSADKIPEDDRYPGAQVEIEGQQGYLETIFPGRARVDFNHPLAGEDIEYDYEVLDVVEDDLERAQGFMDMVFDFDLDMHIETDEVEEEQMVEPDEEEAESEETEEADEESEPEFETVTVEKETLYIESTPQLSMNQQWLFQKQQIAQQLMDQIDIDRVLIQEVIDGQGGMGMPGMMGMGGGAGGGGAGGAGGADIEEALEDADVDADEILDEIDEDIDEEPEE